MNAVNIDARAGESANLSRGALQPLALAMAYVPMQCLKTLYSAEKTLARGTLFPELDKPLKAVKGGSCLV